MINLHIDRFMLLYASVTNSRDYCIEMSQTPQHGPANDSRGQE